MKPIILVRRVAVALHEVWPSAASLVLLDDVLACEQAVGIDIAMRLPLDDPAPGLERLRHDLSRIFRDRALVRFAPPPVPRAYCAEGLTNRPRGLAITLWSQDADGWEAGAPLIHLVIVGAPGKETPEAPPLPAKVTVA